jgi:DNA-binding CsgD family transcriptional regulator
MIEPEVVRDPQSLLSPRELDVLALTARGLTNARAAAELDVTVHAIKFHLASIYRKLGVSNRTQAAAFFLEHRFGTQAPSTSGAG